MADYVVRGMQFATTRAGCRRSNEESKPSGKHAVLCVYMGNRLGNDAASFRVRKGSQNELVRKIFAQIGITSYIYLYM